MHTLLVEDVYVADQGIYTFKVKETTTSTRYQIEANGRTPSSSEARKRRQHDTASLLSRLAPSRDTSTEAVLQQQGFNGTDSGLQLQQQSQQDRKNWDSVDGNARSNGTSDLKVRRQSREFFWSQIRQFNEYAAVQSLDPNPVSFMTDDSDDKTSSLSCLGVNAAVDSDEVFSKDDSVSYNQLQRNCRSLIFSTTNFPIDNLLVRSKSLSSIPGIGSATAGGRNSRRNSEVLYFSYAESGTTNSF
jgi:hypothetical protein